MGFSAVLFDFDGTLANSYPAITASANHVLSHYGKPPISEDHLRILVGHGLEHLMDTLLPGINPEEAAAIYREHHPSVMFSHTELLPGVEVGLAQLHQRGVKMGVCSNKPSYFTQELCRGLNIQHYFATVLGPDLVPQPKPAADMVHSAIETLQANPASTLFVGDMIVDIQTARNAQIPVWVVPTGSNSEQDLLAAQPDRFFADMGALIDSILNSNHH
ncbi:MAG: HAD-IA family hydrolase [Zavarzinella sp.]